jgi:hypothetical protein
VLRIKIKITQAWGVIGISMGMSPLRWVFWVLLSHTKNVKEKRNFPKAIKL